MKYLIIIQARMGSKRFPGKSMHLFNGKSSLSLLVDSLTQKFSKSLIYIATSIKKENHVIRKFAQEQGLHIYSGDEENVASRFLYILEQIEVDYFIRLNGDSPLFDYRLLYNTILNIDFSFDIYSTVFTKRYPAGMNFEIVRKKTFLDEYYNFSDNSHYEHVTKYFYQNSKKFKIQQIDIIINNPETYRFCFDTDADRKRIEIIFNNMNKPHYYYTFQEKCKLYDDFVKE